MDDAQIEILTKTGTAPDLARIVEGLPASEQAIVAQEWSATKQARELATLHERTAEQLVDYETREGEAIDAEAAQALQTIDARLAGEHRVPTKRLDETATDYAARVSAALIHETRAARAATFAQIDAQTIDTTTDAHLIVAILDDALVVNDAEIVRRLGSRAEARLDVLAAVERKKSDGTSAGPAFTAKLMLADKLRAWRAQEDARSPAVARQRVRERAAQRRTELHAQIERTAKAARLEADLTRVRTARLRAQQPDAATAAGLVVGSYFDRPDARGR